MVAAAVAAGVAVAATAASTALQASQGGPNMPTLGGASGLESRMQRRNRDILFAAQEQANRGAFERNLVSPDLYRQAGYDVEYDEESLAAAATARETSDAASERFSGARSTLDALTGPSRKKKIRELKAGGVRGKALKAAKKDLRKQKRTARTDLRESRRDMDTAAMAAQAAESQAGRITGLTYRGLGDDSDRAIDEALSKRVLDAATTGRSTDPRLLRELDESEGAIRARLVRQFGPDYENTTAGAMALNSFRQRKSESLADFARKDITEFNPARLNQRLTLGQIAGQRQNLMLAPSDARFSTSTQMQNLGTSFQRFEEMLQRDRLAQFEGASRTALAEYQSDQARTAAIAGGLNQVASAAGSYGMTMGGASGGGVARPTTVQVPQY
jgi:hypothetical protein